METKWKACSIRDQQRRGCTSSTGERVSKRLMRASDASWDDFASPLWVHQQQEAGTGCGGYRGVS